MERPFRSCEALIKRSINNGALWPQSLHTRGPPGRGRTDGPMPITLAIGRGIDLDRMDLLTTGARVGRVEMGRRGCGDTAVEVETQRWRWRNEGGGGDTRVEVETRGWRWRHEGGGGDTVVEVETTVEVKTRGWRWRLGGGGKIIDNGRA
ncbi:hypothetical protein NHX12_006369 [Muraenolepis orangiensis]|uniref:Uncharacterized protein n=1 Tax=Muraenolepis orangiensis TaxID=630683 RepID=A0A9Q0DTD4_9TELE|nr:hypothetical protein NHX12_006369 [Muraenolepis orangiensis]